jgi:hypothetical protein
MTKEGVPKHSLEFSQKVYDKEEEIRSKIIPRINECIGLHNWAIVFGEMYPCKPNYLADIYAETEDDYKATLDILREQTPDLKLMPFYKGTIANYIGAKE